MSKIKCPHQDHNNFLDQNQAQQCSQVIGRQKKKLGLIFAALFLSIYIPTEVSDLSRFLQACSLRGRR